MTKIPGWDETIEMARRILAERARILREAHDQAGTRHLRPVQPAGDE